MQWRPVGPRIKAMKQTASFSARSLTTNQFPCRVHQLSSLTSAMFHASENLLQQIRRSATRHDDTGTNVGMAGVYNATAFSRHAACNRHTFGIDFTCSRIARVLAFRRKCQWKSTPAFNPEAGFQHSRRSSSVVPRYVWIPAPPAFP